MKPKHHHTPKLAGFLICGLITGMPINAGESSKGSIQSVPPAVGDKAKDFGLESLDGKTIRLHELTKNGPVVLVVLRGFPGYQCPICSAQVAGLRHRAKEIEAAGAQVVLVYPGPAQMLKQRAKEFLRSDALPSSFHLLLDPDYDFVSSYGLRWNAPRETAYPSTFVINSENTILFAKVSKKHGGRASANDVIRALPTK